jgi:hypothetical protein
MGLNYKTIRNILVFTAICSCQSAFAETALEAMGLAYIKEHQALEALGPNATSAQKAALHKEIYSNALKLAGKELAEKQRDFGKKAKNLSKDFAAAMKRMHSEDKKELADKKGKSPEGEKPNPNKKRTSTTAVSRNSKQTDPVEAAGAARVKYNIPTTAAKPDDAAGAAGVKFSVPTSLTKPSSADDAVGAANVKFGK